MRIRIVALFASLLALSSAAPARAQEREGEIETLVKGNTEFALSLYQRLGKTDGNLFLSPYSISNALAMTYAGARGNTAAEMKNTLRFNLDDDHLHPAFGRLITRIHGDGKPRPFQLTVANRLWGQKDYGFLKPFVKITKDHYGAELEEIDFMDPKAGEAGRKKINAWVEKQTNNRIQNLLVPGSIDVKTRLVLTNAIYFNAKWMLPFDEKLTKPEPFHLASGAKPDRPTMHTRAEIAFAQHDDLSLVNLLYEGNDVSMVVILPKKKDGLREVEKQLTPANLQKWTQSLAPHSVDLKMPKFTMTTMFNLSADLKAMGMKDAFDEIAANLKGMGISRGDFNLYLWEVVHKAFIAVDEKKTEAAAATGVIVKATKSARREPPPAVFHADHPFIILIRDQRTGTILFMGRIADPTN